ncbi:permease-like cell division protein FtsX [soil metagenome]
MQIIHIFTELGTGLRRNVSMTLSLVVTTFVSLALVGFGLLVNEQAEATEEYFNGRSTLLVLLCSETSSGGTCVNGEVTREQREAVEAALEENPQVDSYTYETAEEQYEKAGELQEQTAAGRRAYEAAEPANFSAVYTVIPFDPNQVDGISEQLAGMSGIENLVNVADQLGLLYEFLDLLQFAALVIAAFLAVTSVLLVSNTIRLTAYARRKEIGIMRLVGASSWHIQLPFVLESMLATVLAGLLAVGSLAAMVELGVNRGLKQAFGDLTVWIGWSDAVFAGTLTMALAVVLGAIPPLVLTRKYLDV